jgi:hypothetical protein
MGTTRSSFHARLVTPEGDLVERLVAMRRFCTMHEILGALSEASPKCR